MAIKKAKRMRRVVVDGQTYHWKFRQAQDQEPDAFRAYAADDRTCPLRVNFPEFSCRDGVPCIPEHPEVRGVNLYTPAWAATFIRYGLAHGWEPPTKGVTALDGVGVLKALEFTPMRD